MSSLSGKVGLDPDLALQRLQVRTARLRGRHARASCTASGVGVSAVFPGFIRDAGMFAEAGVQLPRGRAHALSAGRRGRGRGRDRARPRRGRRRAAQPACRRGPRLTRARSRCCALQAHGLGGAQPGVRGRPARQTLAPRRALTRSTHTLRDLLRRCSGHVRTRSDDEGRDPPKPSKEARPNVDFKDALGDHDRRCA